MVKANGAGLQIPKKYRDKMNGLLDHFEFHIEKGRWKKGGSKKEETAGKSIHKKTTFFGMNKRDSINIEKPICQTGYSDRFVFHHRNYLLGIVPFVIKLGGANMLEKVIPTARHSSPDVVF